VANVGVQDAGRKLVSWRDFSNFNGTESMAPAKNGARSLARRLADLKDSGRIDARLLNWAHGVRLVGNEAAHDVETAVSAEDARGILEFTVALLMYIFTLDAKFRSFETRRSKRTGGPSAGAAQQGDAPDGAPRRR
jgi:hypothetical protein